jgi:TRAP transporter TAXI family solute receptor
MLFNLNRRSLLAGLGASTAVATLGTSSLAQTGSVRIGTSSVGSVFYTLAVGAGEIIRDVAGINTTVEPVGGSAANINGIARGDIDFAIANSYSAFTGYTGTDAFPASIDIRLVMQGHPSNRFMFVRTGSGIESPADLDGRTIIGERRALPELRLVMDAMIEHYGLDASSINVVSTTNTGEALDAMRAGSVDAVIMPFSPRTAQIEEPMRDGVMTFLPMAEADRDAILDKLPPAFYGRTQPSNEFTNQPDAVSLFALNTYMICSPDVDDETMYNVASAMFSNNERFITYHGTARAWTAKNAVKNFALPFHTGVIRYLTEAGLWGAEESARQQRLLDLV